MPPWKYANIPPDELLEAISKNGFWLNKPKAYRDQGGAEFRAAGILRYVEDLKWGTNTEIGPKDFFEIASTHGGQPSASNIRTQMIFPKMNL